jgi:hypothetical protein
MPANDDKSVDDKKSITPVTPPECIAYFFFDFNDETKQDARALLISLLVQLSNQSDSFTDILYRHHSTHGSEQPEESVLISCLEEMLRIPWKFYLIIDALDECPKDTVVVPRDVPPRRDVLKLVEQLVNLNLANLRLCVTSRFEDDIEAYLVPLTSTPKSTRICLQDQDGQKRDIKQYIRSEIYSEDLDKTVRWTDDDKKLVFNELCEQADGM